jgi:hypothetical protein
MDNFDLKKYLAEGRLLESTQPYEIISKNTKKSEYGDEIYDNYALKLKDETYNTPDNSTFNLETIGYISVPEGEEIDFTNPYHYFYYIETIISDQKGNQLEKIPGMKVSGEYKLSPSLNKVKKWLNVNSNQLMLGKGFQHKST